METVSVPERLLIALVIAGLVSYVFDFEGMGGEVIGSIPSGLPPLVLFPNPAGACFLIGNGGALLVVLIGLT